MTHPRSAPSQQGGWKSSLSLLCLSPVLLFNLPPVVDPGAEVSRTKLLEGLGTGFRILVLRSDYMPKYPQEF